MEFRLVTMSPWPLVFLLLFHFGPASAAVPVALVKELTWNMVKEPMLNGQFGMPIDIIFENYVDATITRTCIVINASLWMFDQV